MDAASSSPAGETPASEVTENQAQVAPKEQDVPEWKRVKHRVPVKGDDGNELEVDYDDLVKNFALNKTLTQRGQEAAAKRKEAEALAARAQAELDAFKRDLERVKENPEILFHLAKQAGLDDESFDSLAEERVWRKIQYEKMSEAEKEAYHAKLERDQLKKEKAEREQKDRAAQEEQLGVQAEKEIEDCVMEAVKFSGLKPTPRLLARIAERTQAVLNATDKLPSPEEVAKYVRDWYHQDYSELYDSDDISVEDLIEKRLLSDKLLNKIQKYLLNKASKNVPSFGSSRQATNPGKPAKKQSISVDEFFKRL